MKYEQRSAGCRKSSDALVYTIKGAFPGDNEEAVLRRGKGVLRVQFTNAGLRDTEVS